MSEFRISGFYRWPLKSAYIQSLWSPIYSRTFLCRRIMARGFRNAAETLILDCGAEVRLKAYVNTPEGTGNGRVVVMMHGWTGDANEDYMLSIGPLLLEQGYKVVRLNLRDHDDTHRLNEGVFHSCLLDEVMGALHRINELYPSLSMSLVGFSLGANFVLRLAALAGRTSFDLDRVVAVCPVIDPVDTMEVMDRDKLLLFWFLRGWKKSLKKKQDAFPKLYEDFDDLLKLKSLTAMTNHFVPRHTGFPDMHAYLRAYALTGNRLADLRAETFALMSDDDPVIPLRQLSTIQMPEVFKPVPTKDGGHCGYHDKYFARIWRDDFILDSLAA